jgi:hypothetical protein
MPRPFDIVVTLVVVGLFGVGLWSQNAEDLASVALGDTDDVLRLVQAEDLLAGQAWGDLTQHRLGVGDGVPMHWTRHVDALVAPILAVGGPTAAAIIVPLLLLAALALTLVAWWRSGPERSDRLVLLLAALPTVLVFSQFAPGRLDHHGLQVVLAVGGSVLLMRGAWIWGGALVGGALAVGLDALVAVLGLLVALGIAWAASPERSRIALLRVPSALLCSAVLGTVLFAADARIWSRVCDVFALPVAMALAAATAGCAVIVARPAGSLVARVGQLGVVGVGAIAALALARPACLGGPLVDIPADVTSRWLTNVSETQSLLEFAGNRPFVAAATILPIAVALVFMVRALRSGDLRWVPALGLLCGAAATTTIHVRGASLAIGLALPAFGLVAVAVRSRPWPLPRITTPLVLVVSLLVANGFLAIAGFAAFGAEDLESQGPGLGACTGRERLSTLAAEDPGVVLANLDLGPSILFHTDHSAIAGPYHRNIDGIRLAFDLLDAPTAGPDLAAAGVDLVVVCPGQAGNGLYTTTGDTSLMARLLAGDDVDGLVAVAGDGPLRVWRVTAQP